MPCCLIPRQINQPRIESKFNCPHLLCLKFLDKGSLSMLIGVVVDETAFFQ